MPLNLSAIATMAYPVRPAKFIEIGHRNFTYYVYGGKFQAYTNVNGVV